MPKKHEPLRQSKRTNQTRPVTNILEKRAKQYRANMRRIFEENHLPVLKSKPFFGTIRMQVHAPRGINYILSAIQHHLKSGGLHAFSVTLKRGEQHATPNVGNRAPSGLVRTWMNRSEFPNSKNAHIHSCFFFDSDGQFVCGTHEVIQPTIDPKTELSPSQLWIDFSLGPRAEQIARQLLAQVH